MSQSHDLAVRLRDGRAFAGRWHATPRPNKPQGDRYGAFPYTKHLDDVLSIAFEYGEIDEDVLVGTRGHDLLEDVPEVTAPMVAIVLGEGPLYLIIAMSKPKGLSRKKGASIYYAQLIAAGRPAVRLKLYDRIANVRSCWAEAQRMDEKKRNRSKLGMYKSEYGAFRKALRPAEPDALESALWAELDRLMAWLP